MYFLAIYDEFTHLGVLWLAVALVALLVKVFTKEYVSLCVAIGAIAASLSAFIFFENKLPYQIVVAVVGTFIAAGFIMPYAIRKNEEYKMKQAREKNIPHRDEIAEVIETIDNMNCQGMIKIGDETFKARTANGVIVEVGNKVRIVDHDRDILLVV